MSVAASSTTVGSEQSWSPARIFMLVGAIVHIPLGIVGLLYNQAFPVGSSDAAHSASDHIFGIFMTNGWHSSAALGLGIAMTYFTLNPRRAREAALAIGLFHVGIFIGLVLFDPSTFWLASNGADQVIHASTAIFGTGSALLTRRDRPVATASG